MKNKRCLKVFWQVLFLIVICFIWGCQTFSFHRPDEKVLENRTAEMMAARVTQNWGTVYDYLTPDYKQTISKQGFQNMPRNIFYRNFSLESIRIDPTGDKAKVVVKYDMTMMGYEVKNHRETQNWIKKGGKWYFVAETGSPMGTQ